MSSGDKSLTVDEYCRRFCERTANIDAAEGAEDVRIAGQKFYSLLLKLKEAGSKDDVKVPLRVLRDEIGRIYFGGATHKAGKIETLFTLYDALETGAQNDLRLGNQAAAASQILEELRLRFSRLVIGDTWDAWPELKLAALKRMHAYSVREKQAAKESTPASLPPALSGGGGRLGMRKLSRSFSGAAGSPANATWQSTIDDLAKAPGSRLMPILKLLLNHNSDLAEEPKAGQISDGVGSDAAVKASSEGLLPQPSGVSESADLTRRVADLDMDDLLGLGDAKDGKDPEPSGGAAAPDPFAAAAMRQREERNTAQEPRLATAPSGEGNGAFHQQGYPAVMHSQYSGSLNGAYGGNISPRGSYTKPLSPHASYGSQPPAPFSYIGQQRTSSGAFEESAFAPSTAPGMPSQLRRLHSGGSAASDHPGGFNPFGLPSPRFSTPVSPHADNSFANFSPVAAAPAAPMPQPMRAPPQPPTAQSYTQQPQQQQQEFSAPHSSFSAW